MKKSVVVLFLLISFCKSYSQTGWSGVHTPIAQINDFQFVNSLTGFICGEKSGVAKTTNGGATWISFTGFEDSLQMQTINFTDVNTGWVGGWKTLGNHAGPFRSIIYSTTNSGANWVAITQSSDGRIPYDLKMLGRDSVLIGYGGFQPNTSTYGMMTRTTDAGNNFQVSLSEPNYQYFGFQFFNKITGWAISSKYAGSAFVKNKIHKTTDSGVTWNVIYFDSTIRVHFNDVFFVNENTGYVCGDKGLFAKTTNGGASWAKKNIPGESDVNTIYFMNELTGFCGAKFVNVIDSLALRRTTDGGLTWRFAPNNFLTLITKIDFIDNLTGWAIGNGYPLSQFALIKTITGGVTSAEEIQTLLPEKFALSQNFPNPFNPVTKINFELPITNYVSLKIYDMMGREVKELVSEVKQAGYHSITFDAANLSSGVYFYKISVSGEGKQFVKTLKMLLLK